MKLDIGYGPCCKISFYNIRLIFIAPLLVSFFVIRVFSFDGHAYLEPPYITLYEKIYLLL